MSDNKPPRYFWIVSAIMLVWNLLGIAAYLADVMISAERLAGMPAAQRALYEGMPAWATGAYAIAVFGGTLGCITLLLKKSLALPLFVVSLLGVLAQMGHAFLGSNTLEVMGPTSAIMPAVITVIAVFLIWFASSAKNRQWLS